PVLAENRLLVRDDRGAGHLAGFGARRGGREEQGAGCGSRDSQSGEPLGGANTAFDVHWRWFPFVVHRWDAGLSKAARQRRTYPRAGPWVSRHSAISDQKKRHSREPLGRHPELS